MRGCKQFSFAGGLAALVGALLLIAAPVRAAGDDRDPSSRGVAMPQASSAQASPVQPGVAARTAAPLQSGRIQFGAPGATDPDTNAIGFLLTLMAAMLGSLGTAAWLVLAGSTHRPQALRPPPLPNGFVQAFRSDAGVTTEMALNSQASITALIDQAHVLVAELATAPPLRDVLEGELDIIDTRLRAISDVNAENFDPRRVASTYRVLVRDCERIRRIADSALASFASPRSRLELPQTKGEAYAVLGANPDVAEPIMKRLVDALRLSWHPDLARDEADRVAREARVTQINVAWDLIIGKRVAA